MSLTSFTEAQQRVLDQIADYEYRTGEVTPVAEVLLDASPEQAPALQQVLESLHDGGFIRLGGHSREVASLRRLGVLRCTGSREWGDLGAKLLAYLKGRLSKERSTFQDYTWNQLTKAGVCREGDYPALRRLIQIFTLSQHSATSSEPTSTTNWSVPAFLIELRTIETLEQLHEFLIEYLGEASPQDSVAPEELPKTAMLIFPDTNVFLHYRVREIPWSKLAGADEVVIMVAPGVTRELDQHKYSPSRSLKRKAEKALHLIRENQVSTGVTLQRASRVGRAVFEKHDLDRGNPDECILASALQHSYGSNEVVLLATGDEGFQSMADHYGMSLVLLDKNYRHTEPEDPEVTTLKQTVADLRKRVDPTPVLSLAFKDGEQHIELDLELRPVASEKIDELVDLEKECRKIAEDIGGINVASAVLGRRPPSEEEVFEHYRKYRKYLTTLAKRNELKARTIELALVLENTGSAPAEKVMIQFDPPEHINVLETEDLPTPPKPPVLKDHTLLDVNPARIDPVVFSRLMQSDVTDFRQEGFFEHEACWRWQYLQHHTDVDVIFHVRFLDAEQVLGFSLPYKVHASNMVTPVLGTLHFKVNCSQRPGPTISDIASTDDENEDATK